MSTADLESDHITLGPSSGMASSMSKSRTKIRSLAAIIAPKYSASAELKETDFCIFENQWNRHP
jgi:hypothetical protein